MIAMFALTTDSPTRHGGMVTRLGLALAALLALLVGLALPGGADAAPPSKASYSTRTLYFGYQSLSTAGVAQTVTLKAKGNWSFTTSGVTLGGANPGDFLIASDTCTNATTKKNAPCAVTVQFTPTTLGARNAILTFATTAGGNNVVSLSGFGAAPAVSLSTTTLNFANQQVNTTGPVQTVALVNSGTAPLTVGTVALGGADASQFGTATSTCGASIAPGTGCTVDVRFQPTTTGAKGASLAFTDNAAGSPHLVTLSGTATPGAPTPAPFASVAPAVVVFGNQMVGQTSGTKTVTLTNVGGAGLNAPAVTLAGDNAGDFAITNNNCTGTLAANASCTVTVTFTPSASLTRVATLVFTDNAANTPQSVALVGVGTAPAALLSTTGEDLGGWDLGTTSDPLTVQVTNIGNSGLTFSNVALSGPAASDYTLQPGGTCTGTLAPATTCTANVTVTPSIAGVRAATLAFSDNAPTNPQTVALTATGTVPGVGFSVPGLTFGNQVVGTPSAAQAVALTNTGANTLTITAIAVTGGNAGDFTVSGCGGITLDPDAACAVSVVFTPGAAGPRSASLTVTTSATAGAQSLPLNGTGVAPSVSPSPSPSSTPSPTPSANPVAQYRLTVTTIGGGTASGAGLYTAGTVASLIPTADRGQLFLGWTVDGVAKGWANPLTITMGGEHTAMATFGTPPAFTDVPGGSAAADPIARLAARQVIRGYGDGTYGPDDTTKRAQMAALIARAMGWSDESWGNNFADQSGVDNALWRNVGTLAHYGVARGYNPAAFGPTDNVLRAQTISFITRAMEAKGYWVAQPIDPTLFGGVLNGTGHEADVATYLHYVGGIAGADGAWSGWDSAATRGWFAQALWDALDSYFGHDAPGLGGYVE
jgi:hypothetical protein